MSPQVYQKGLAIPGKKKHLFPSLFTFFLTTLLMLFFPSDMSSPFPSKLTLSLLPGGLLSPARHNLTIKGIVAVLIHFIFL